MLKLYILIRKNYTVERVSQIIGRPPIEWENLSKDTTDIKKELNSIFFKNILLDLAFFIIFRLV